MAGRGKRLFEWALSFGEYPGEPDEQRGKRRIIVGAWWFAIFGVSLGNSHLIEGRPLLAAAFMVEVAAAVAGLLAIRRWPHRFTWTFVFVFAAFLTVTVIETVLRGGLLPSGLAAMWAIMPVLAALIALSVRAASVFFGVFIAIVVFSVWIPNVVEPRYPNDDPAGDVAVTMVAIGVLAFAVLAYFVRQRDMFQEQSDGLLRNVLPEEIALRLKHADGSIADRFDHATVLFADVVGFTPLSMGMSPEAVVALLEEIFTDLDDLVGGLGLEKIKTVGDEYMVASGLPTPRPDHALASAELALRIRDLMATKRYGGNKIELRMGIHSGPVVAGVIGQRKFAYDLWGDTVNMASRLESHGVAGKIQISAETAELISMDFVCEPRGLIDLKGKGPVETWLLTGRVGAALAE